MRGEKPTGGYGIEVKSVEDVEGRTVVYVQETDPGKNDILPQIVTNPYTIIRVKNSGHMVSVKNLQGHDYSYYITRDCPVTGTAYAGGTFKDMYEENNFIFIEIQGSDNQTQLFYVPDNDEWKDKLKNLKANMHAYIKYSLGTPQKSKDKVAMPLISLGQHIPVIYDNKCSIMEYSKKVSSNKEWTVSLNKEVNEKNVNNSNVYVTDANGNNIPVKISISENSKAIKITPVESYKIGQTYYLIITNNIYSNFKGLKMQFTITN